MKPMFKAPGTKRLKLKCDEALLNFAFNLHLRRYSMGVKLVHLAASLALTTTNGWVGRCRLNP